MHRSSGIASTTELTKDGDDVDDDAELILALGETMTMTSICVVRVALTPRANDEVVGNDVKEPFGKLKAKSA